MLILKTIKGVRARRQELRRIGTRVAFVPTMGALHAGHLGLVQRGRELCDEVWASVFVNPAQFSPGEDFERYPRNEEADAALLESWGTTLLFAPTTKEIYPRPSATVIDLPELTSGLCGAFRGGHFRGVALVVTKLLNIVQPDVAVFGAKDWQQAAVVRRLVADLDIPVRIEVVPTVRECDGLAMSSRNAYLGPAERSAATILFRALTEARARIQEGLTDVAAVKELLLAAITAEPQARVQYVAVVEPDTLEPLEHIESKALLALAVFIGQTRLIDNMLVEVKR